jgi:methylmalonyl-CoA mutase cobalamin-binding subunit
MNKIKRAVFILRIFVLKMKARRLAKKTGAQYFIVKLGGNITLLSKPAFKSMRWRGVFAKSFTATELKKVALYYTKNPKIQ